MTTLAPYIGFDGKSRDALAFYEKAFGNGARSEIMSVGDTPVPADQMNGVKPEDVMHAEFNAGAVKFFCTDCGAPGAKPITESRISMALNLDDQAEQTRLFDALAEGGTVTMPLGETFWKARFGMLKDRFGIEWMLNCQHA